MGSKVEGNRRHDYLEPARLADHEHGRSVDQQPPRRHVRVLLSYLIEDAVPQHPGVLEGVSLADAGDAAALPAGEFERPSDDALGAVAREHGGLQRGLPIRAWGAPAS